MIKRLAHVCLMTHQLDAQVLFYRDVMGLPIQFTLKGRDRKVFGCYFGLGNTTFLEIFDLKGANKQWGGTARILKEDRGDGFYQHFCLEVENLKQLAEHLKSHGVKVTPIKIGLDGSYQAWIQDPDSNQIELMEYTGKSLQLKKAVSVGKRRSAS